MLFIVCIFENWDTLNDSIFLEEKKQASLPSPLLSGSYKILESVFQSSIHIF